MEVSWRDCEDRKRIIRCPHGHEQELDADECAAFLKATKLRDGGTAYGYGDLITDPLAVIRRALTFSGWVHEGGRTNSMTCPIHRKNDS